MRKRLLYAGRRLSVPWGHVRVASREIASCQANMDEAISIAKELKDVNALALALRWAAGLACAERNLAEVDRLASDLMELSVRYNFSHWLAIGAIYRGWARSASGNTAEGIALIELSSTV